MMRIHVFDEHRNVTRDFSCSKALLQQHMKLLAAYRESEIEVQCDINVFEWLIKYVIGQRPVLDNHNVVSIVVSCNFLMMRQLENTCLDYIAENINDVIKVPIDLSSLNSQILRNLVRKMSAKQIVQVHDAEDKLRSQLCKFKTEHYFRQNKRVYQCRFCKELFVDDTTELSCANAPAEVGYDGALVKTHESTDEFDINVYVARALKRGTSWAHLLSRFTKVFDAKQFRSAETHDAPATAKHLTRTKSIAENDELQATSLCDMAEISATLLEMRE